MATTTPNFGLRKPTVNDNVNVKTDIADNMDLLDAHAHSGTYVAVDTLVVNVKDHGAVGDGTTDDTAAFAAAFAALPVGGGKVYAPPGTYMLTLAAQGTANYFAGIVVPTNCWLQGAGRAATTFKLLANQTPDIGIGNGVSVIFNDVLTGGDEHITLSDFTVDGNGANQTKLHNGITFIRTRGCKVHRVLVKNVRGTGNSPPDETFHFDTQLGVDTTYIDCEAVGDAGTQGSGFSANNATNIKWIGCSARGMSEGHGFTAHQCVDPSWHDCWAYLNGSHGFNVEESLHAFYDSCYSGGESALGTTPFPYTAGTSLGNGDSGFVVNGCARARLVNCTGHKNGDSGLSIVAGSASYGACSGRVVGGNFTYNAFAGISVGATVVPQWQISSDTTVTNNVTAPYDLPTGYTTGPGSTGAHVPLSPTPSIPSSGVDFENPFPFRVTVYVLGGDLSEMRVGTTNVMSTTGFGAQGRPALRLTAGQNLRLTYTVAPTWVWEAD